MSKAAPSFEPVPEHALPQWRRLQDELREHFPVPCYLDPGYTTDETPTPEALAACDYCPARQACGDFAEAWRPTSGVWAGQVWRPKGPGRPRRKEEPQ